MAEIQPQIATNFLRQGRTSFYWKKIVEANLCDNFCLESVAHNVQ